MTDGVTLRRSTTPRVHADHRGDARDRAGPSERRAASERTPGDRFERKPAPVPAFLRKAADLRTALGNVETLVERVTADDAITRAERRVVLERTRAVMNRAQRMVPDQGRPAVNALQRIETLTERGQLVERQDEATRRLANAGTAVWNNARADRREDPFDHLRGFTRRFPGVRSKDFTWEGKRAHVVAIDLANPKVGLSTNPESQRGRTVDGAARARGAEIAINGDFFSGGFRPSGLAMTGGKKWSGTSEQSWEGTISWNGSHVEINRRGTDHPKWATNAVSARPAVLADGKVITDYSSDPTKAVASRRTGAGVSRDGRVLYLVAVENCSAKDLGRLLRRHGAWDGLAMDAGGSAQMYQRGRGLVQSSSDPGGRRAVANSLFVQAG